MLELLKFMERRTIDDACIRFVDIVRGLGWHQQRVTRLLKMNIRMGIIAKCSDGRGYELTLSRFNNLIEEVVKLMSVRLTDSGVIMSHRVDLTIRNTGLIDIGYILVKVYGDLDYSEPLRIIYNGVEHIEKMNEAKCPQNYCVILLKLDKPIKTGEILKYSYLFNLHYFSPNDYFTVDAFFHIKRLSVKIPRRAGTLNIDLDSVNLMGSGAFKVTYMGDYNIIIARELTPGSALRIGLAIN